MTTSPHAPLTTNEEVTLRRVAYGQSSVRAMRRHDLTRLHELHLIKDSQDGPRLTTVGKLRFDILPRAALLETTGPFDMLKMVGRRLQQFQALRVLDRAGAISLDDDTDAVIYNCDPQANQRAIESVNDLSRLRRLKGTREEAIEAVWRDLDEATQKLRETPSV